MTSSRTASGSDAAVSYPGSANARITEPPYTRARQVHERTTLTSIALFASSDALAGCVTQQIGQVSYHSCSNGVSGTSQKIGNITHHNFSNGVRGTSQQIGSITHHNIGGETGTSQKIGRFTYHDED